MIVKNPLPVSWDLELDRKKSAAVEAALTLDRRQLVQYLNGMTWDTVQLNVV